MIRITDVAIPSPYAYVKLRAEKLGGLWVVKGRECGATVEGGGLSFTVPARPDPGGDLVPT